MRKEKEPEKSGEYRKLCIISHVQHEVYIDAISVSELESKYNGEEEAFIKDAYDYPDDYLKNGYVTWEWFLSLEAYGAATDAITTHYINEL